MDSKKKKQILEGGKKKLKQCAAGKRSIHYYYNDNDGKLKNSPDRPADEHGNDDIETNWRLGLWKTLNADRAADNANTTRSYGANYHCVTHKHVIVERRRRVHHTHHPTWHWNSRHCRRQLLLTADCCSSRRRRRLRCRSHVFRVSTNYVAAAPRSGACARAFHSYARTHEARFFVAAAAKPQKKKNSRIIFVNALVESEQDWLGNKLKSKAKHGLKKKRLTRKTRGRRNHE